jgi:hypothetical protein
MKKNVGKMDKIIRITLGIGLTLGAIFLAKGLLQIILGFLSFMMFFTTLTSYCFLYTLLGLNTCKIKDK